MEWYDEASKGPFDFRREILEYCRNDVDILRQACLAFRSLLMESTGRLEAVIDEDGESGQQLVGAIDPFDYVTIASVCMGVYRRKFLEETWRVRLSDQAEEDWIPAKMSDGILSVRQDGEWVSEKDLLIEAKEFVDSPIASIPPRGYKDQYSKSSIHWLEWMMRKKDITIRHALNGGEKKLVGTRYKLDGYCEATHTAWEYHGCAYHGCPVCFPHDREETMHPFTAQSMSELHALTLKKKAYIQGLGMRYECIWEHDFQQQCKSNAQLSDFIKTLDTVDRLNPRDSFFGGRTNASRLHYKVSEGEKVKYVDFTSLYPWVNKYARYPLGHPEIITSDFKDLDQYFGIAQVKIRPPRSVYHPVLPTRSNGKLKFSLCRTCADTENQSTCICRDEDRVMIGTWCIPEILKAVEKGYIVEKVYEVYHWSNTTQYDANSKSGGLFSEYMNTFLKIKQESSGPPEWIHTKHDTEIYIEKYLDKEGVELEAERIEKNPGLRAISKLCMNSFGGKFGQRLNMHQTEFIHESEIEKFFQTLTDTTKEVVNFHIVAPDTIQLDWHYKKDFIPEDNKTNIYLATFTTCWARLKLYDVLQSLEQRVLYYDTDSVIYVSRPDQYDPPLGDYLGDLTSEIEGSDYIEEFVSGGPKNYAYRTNSGKEVCKVRGFTLNFRNSQIVNLESMKEIVTTTEATSRTILNPHKICRDKRKRKLYNRAEEKIYQMVYTKRARLDDFNTLPYGY
jgi:hypothetical protein